MPTILTTLGRARFSPAESTTPGSGGGTVGEPSAPSAPKTCV